MPGESGGGDVLCYAAGANPDNESSQIHYLADGIPVAVCGVDPGKRLPYIPLSRLGSRHDPKNPDNGWNWCSRCCRILNKPLVKAPPPQADEDAPVASKNGKAGSHR